MGLGALFTGRDRPSLPERASLTDFSPSWNKARYGKQFVMKVVLLAGGLGTRITEECATKPKPMVEIGGRPIL